MHMMSIPKIAYTISFDVSGVFLYFFQTYIKTLAIQEYPVLICLMTLYNNNSYLLSVKYVLT